MHSIVMDHNVLYSYKVLYDPQQLNACSYIVSIHNYKYLGRINPITVTLQY